jgi:hypothetical protein
MIRTSVSKVAGTRVDPYGSGGKTMKGKSKPGP